MTYKQIEMKKVENLKEEQINEMIRISNIK